MKLRLGLPKGSLQEATFRLFSRAGYHISLEPRSYYPSIDDAEIEGILMRAQEIPRYVADGALDAGISGKDWVLESRAEVVRVCDLIYSKGSYAPARWVVAVDASGPIKKLSDLKGKRVATELVEVTRDFLARAGIDAAVEYSWGATEVKVPDLVDAIVELTETGSSLRANNLRQLETVLETNTQLLANTASWQETGKKKKLEHLALLLQGALLAEEKVGLKMNVPADKLSAILGLLPALRQPTVSPLAEGNWVAVETVLDEKTARDLIFKLREAGAEGIIEYPLNKVIP
ncbi:MAG: ATP phosphoribosyltransferase [Armatimonadetes bacterium]|nr:ATP phosphoribosyltransferase [Armatimonadota bacterium]NIM23841.1 ATP phosphoribosyltransferase [Armatimonadota bacterium]NIM67720.1 ATP phosphoribosyltransferase [Armatimonadota bacterium]NIM76229.1 ATP phosphoribosyltransferase [Armatimonadota bacterium]NIN05922.1 ATP phosphoribosyltransferase [Armatimonadota bacterium]